jgi:hypothetical protein
LALAEKVGVVVAALAAAQPAAAKPAPFFVEDGE